MKHLVVIVLLVVAMAAVPAVAQTAMPPAHDHAQGGAHNEVYAPCQQMMDEHMAEIKATSQALATNLAQLKSMLPLISSLNERDRWQANIAMWQAMADHFNHMVQQAERMRPMGMNCGMIGHGMTTMEHGAEDSHDHSVPPAKPQ